MNVKTVAAMALVLCCVAALAQAQPAKTPEATSFGLWVNDAEHLVIGIVETVPWTDEGVGFVIGCAGDRGAWRDPLLLVLSARQARTGFCRAPSGRVREVSGRWVLG